MSFEQDDLPSAADIITRVSKDQCINSRSNPYVIAYLPLDITYSDLEAHTYLKRSIAQQCVWGMYEYVDLRSSEKESKFDLNGGKESVGELIEFYGDFKRKIHENWKGKKKPHISLKHILGATKREIDAIKEKMTYEEDEAGWQSCLYIFHGIETLLEEALAEWDIV